MKITENELKQTLAEAVIINALDFNKGRYKYSKRFKEVATNTCKDKTLKTMDGGCYTKNPVEIGIFCNCTNRKRNNDNV